MRRVWIGFVAALAALCSQPSQAQTSRGEMDAAIKDYLARHPEEVERIVRDYLVGNPEVVQQAILEMIKKRQPGLANGAPPARPDKSAEIKANAALLFDSPH